jgi:hypothetical protein
MCELFRQLVTTIEHGLDVDENTLHVLDIVVKVKRRPSFPNPNDARWAVFCPLVRSSPGVEVLPNMVSKWSRALDGIHLLWTRLFFTQEDSGWGVFNEMRDHESGHSMPAEMSCIPFPTGRCILNIIWSSRSSKKVHFGIGGISTVLQAAH